MKDLRKILLCLATWAFCVLNCSASNLDENIDSNSPHAFRRNLPLNRHLWKTELTMHVADIKLGRKDTKHLGLDTSLSKSEPAIPVATRREQVKVKKENRKSNRKSWPAIIVSEKIQKKVMKGNSLALGKSLSKSAVIIPIDYEKIDESLRLEEEEDDLREFPPKAVRRKSLTVTYNFPSLRPTLPVKIVLTIDGGGSRGRIPLFYLRELMRRLSVETGKTIEKLPVDIYGGVSVGALIATVAAAGKINELDQKYASLVNKIFSYSWWKWPFTKFFRGYIYNSEGRAEAIRSFLPPKIERNIESDLIIPFCSAKTNDIFTYTNYDGTQQFSLFDALMASSAAPTYFPPHIFTGLDGKKYEGTDGGCFANHPGLTVLKYALEKYPLSKIVMISLGTGHCRAAGNSTQNFNLLNWATTVPGLFMDLHSTSTNDILMSMADFGFRNDSFTYIRINPVLDREDCITDGVSERHLEHLETVARQAISNNGNVKEKFDKAVEILKEKIR